MSPEIKVLVVDDEPAVCRNCDDMLSAKGWVVETAFNGKDGLAKIRAKPFDLVVLDLDLPDAAGLDLLRHLRKNAPGTPVVAITREPSMTTAVQAIKDGAFDCLAIPFSTHEMRRAAELALHSRLVTPSRSGMPAAPVVVVRAQPELCYACLSCIVACAYSNLGLSADAPLRPELLSAARLSVEAAGGYSVPLHCMQCADAPCLLVCPTGALQRSNPNSPIFAVVARCIGCKSCVLACPFGVLTLDAGQRVVQKCDQCLCRTREGRQPACVENCPTDALVLVNLDELTADKTKACARETASRLKKP